MQGIRIQSQNQNNNNSQKRSIYYCWSCNFDTNSDTFIRKREDHIATATKDSRQGGCLRNVIKLRVKIN